MSQVVEKADRPKRKKPNLHPYPWYSPRFWHGMRFSDWMGLLRQNRFRVSPTRIPLGCTVTAVSVLNSAASFVQRLFYHRKIEATQWSQPPVFIIGHWRSGTTYLHELMVCDPRFGFPTTFECFAPNHFLISSCGMPQLLGGLLPGKRPMDNMSAGFQHPQEDEFALCNMGSPSPYLRMAFPNEPPPWMELLNMKNVDAAALARWKRDITYFVKALTYAKQKQLILKSPPHTGRIGVLSELFPDARFVHIARNPAAIFSSTRRLWPALDAVQGLQVPKYDNLDEYIFTAFERMYDGYFEHLPTIDANRLVEVRYEDVVRDPVDQIAKIYEQLELGDFSCMRRNLQEYLGDTKDYKPNRHDQLSDDIQTQIRSRWTMYIERYGYDV